MSLLLRWVWSQEAEHPLPPPTPMFHQFGVELARKENELLVIILVGDTGGVGRHHNTWIATILLDDWRYSPRTKFVSAYFRSALFAFL